MSKRSGEALTRGVVRGALGVKPWVEPLLFAFMPVFALLAAVTPASDTRIRCAWAALSVGAGVVAVFSFAEQRRRVSLVLDLCSGRRELAEGRFAHEGGQLSSESALRSFPIGASLFVVGMRSATCPSSRRRPGAQALAIAVNLLFGWWSLSGLARTPILLWLCARGGEVTTPAELVETVDAYVARGTHEKSSTGIKVLLSAIAGVAFLFALALLIVRLTT